MHLAMKTLYCPHDTPRRKQDKVQGDTTSLRSTTPQQIPHVDVEKQNHREINTIDILRVIATCSVLTGLHRGWCFFILPFPGLNLSIRYRALLFR